ncbi:periplasmic copper-binding protein [Oligella ureolytica]|uniref:Copper-binding protein n=1 Tax=Oligella ureolytica TaxID=90244 RepID=A0A378XI63_9BURK|nr:copper-binding protein [Oligella ureolytica]NLP32305.1 copper-binding protein [Oligella ureolytica]QPT39357.1 copper-binding protein [Oligella ureolytica]SUA55780.1 periplasmic copper-binding protein [Oligella ureolytica]SUA57204.1 periplasmic copper-binding protein [Oligella ureolytica]
MKKFLAAAVMGLSVLGVAAVGSAQDEASARGEVRRLDASKGTITIKHGAISDLNLPAMTLVYEAEPVLLEGVQPGDQVRFKVRHENNTYRVIELKK